MNTHLNTKAQDIRGSLRQTEGALDDALFQTAGLMQAMLSARQIPDVTPHAGHRSLLRIARAMQRQLQTAIDIFRVHDELSELAATYNVLDRDHSTPESGFQDSDPVITAQAKEAAAA